MAANTCTLGAFSCKGDTFASQTIFQCDYDGWVNLGGPVECDVEGAQNRIVPTSRGSGLTVSISPTPTTSQYATRSQIEGPTTQGPKMASTYDADENSSFRCQNASSCYPPDNMFAAVWTPVNPTVVGYQDDDLPCCEQVDISNPADGTTVKVTIIDRCCSCVGKCKSYGNDPSCGGFVPNGATIDLSPQAFQALFKQTTGVFPVEYSGSAWLGTKAVPENSSSCEMS